MSIKSSENPMRTDMRHWPLGPAAPRVKPWLGGIQVQLEKELGESSCRYSGDGQSVIRPEESRVREGSDPSASSGWGSGGNDLWGKF